MGNFSRRSPPTPTVPPSASSTYTYSRWKKLFEDVLIRPLIIRSSSTPSLFCLALFLFHVLPVTINNSSLPALPCSIQNHSVKPEEVWGGGDQFQPTYWILNRTTKLRSDILAFKLLSHNIKGSSVARWLLGATGVMMWIISLLGFTMRAVQRATQTHLHQF